MKLPNFKSSPNALVKCDCCERNVSYFFDGGQYYSENCEVLYRCEACQPEVIAAAAESAAREAEIDSYYDTKRDLYSAGKQYDHNAVTEHLKRCGVMGEGAMTKRQGG